ncbi:MAG TPA: hypothetical protein DCZ69_07175 [Syntrophobacteraceae bacterium]|nr:hypothetical protein [Syntrophobacteraceae bacterium]
MLFETPLEQARTDRSFLTPVLIIDDESSLLAGLKEFLDDEGFEVHLAGNGKEGLRIFHELQPDLVVTDLRMPGLSGLDVIRQIRATNPHSLVIVMSGYGSMETAVTAIRLNVFDFIGKPIDLDEFRKILDRARQSLSVSRKSQGEIEAQKEQLGLAKVCLNEYRQRLSEVESLALAGQHLAGILHNLISPLSNIMGNAQMLRMLYPEMERLEKIEAQAVRMEKIIGTILGKLKHSQARQEESVQLNEILREEVIFLEAHPFFKHEVHTILDLAPELPEFMGVAADVSQVFGNLLRNAVEALQGQPVRELIISSRYDDHQVCVSIEDSGPGIPEGMYEHIFQPFYSTKTNSVGVSGGLGNGLGLYSCRQLVNQYGGSIEVESRQGVGTKFIIRLPAVKRALDG